MEANQTTHASMGLFGATGVGVGAIVGGGILALAGVAFSVTGPAALVAFALNGVIALLTALSMAEMASRFPESGGTYTFSRKLLSVEAAFAVGWVVWFASVVAAVLYALGFAHFALLMINELWSATGRDQPAMLANSHAVTGLALLTTAVLSLRLIWASSGGGQWANVAKVVVFAFLILGGCWALARQPLNVSRNAMSPFFAGGGSGLLQAMGYSFIALQGFDLIAAVSGDVRNAQRVVPRAMLLSLAIALAIYLPLLLVISTVGMAPGESIQEIARENPEGIVAIAARNYLGPVGYWLVIVAAVLSMFTALQANLYAASRIAHSMAANHTLPAVMSRVSANRGSPATAILVTGALVCLLAVVLPSVAAAGAASSLIFLVTFAIAHALSVLVRLRSRRRPPPFQTPWFPAVPVCGGVACLGLAVFQGFAVPTAGGIAMVWLSLGGVLFLSLFARRARLMDVSSLASDPELLSLRGHTPLVLVPIANPRNAQAMITLADVLAPAEVGRVLVQSVTVAGEQWDPEHDHSPIERSQAVLGELIRASIRVGIRFESLTTVASHPMEEIARVAELHRCESVLLGLSEISSAQDGMPLEQLLGQLDTDVVILRAPQNWQLSDAKNVLVPVAGRGGHDHLLARLLGSLSRAQKREVTFLRCIAQSAPERLRQRTERELVTLAKDNLPGPCERKVVRSDDPIAAVAEAAEQCGLLILGIQRLGRREKLFGRFTRELAKRTTCPLIVISRRG